MTQTVLQYVFYVAVVVILAIPLGGYMGKVMNGEKVWLSKILKPCEHFVYKIMRVDEGEDMGWKKYTGSVLLFNLFGFLLLFFMQLFQGYLPGNPVGLPNVSWDLSLNTAVSFMTNTNWQAYSGECTLSYLTQALGLTVQNFVSAATGIAVLFALIRGFVRVKQKGIGSFWVDMTRIVLYILIPLSLVVSILIGTQGVVQNLKTGDYVSLLEPVVLQPVAYEADGETAIENAEISKDAQGNYIVKAEGKVVEDAVVNDEPVEGAVVEGDTAKLDGKEIANATIVREAFVPQGPAASQVAIKQLGTNGGGYYGVNSAYPLENPTPFSNLLEMLSILLIPVALCFTFGRNVKDKKQGVAIFMAMLIMLVACLATVAVSEQMGTPQLAQGGAVDMSVVNQAGGNMEGKEARFGIAPSATWATFTTAASNGSVNSMHDSYTPLGGMITMLLMELGEVVFGGVGCGLYTMLAFVIFTVFIAGLMVGRTPEYLGKKIEPYEMKMASLAVLATPLVVLIGTAVAAMMPEVADSLNNSGPHGFSELLYAYSSAGGNNGSAFAGFGANTPFLNVTLALVMLGARFIPMVAILAVAGSMVQKKKVATTAGTLSTSNALFVFLLIFVVLLIGALSFFPALSLGPIAEQVRMFA